MTTITNIAQRILDENNYTTSDITTTNVEYLIKNAVDHINTQTGRTISFTPSAGTASLTAQDDEMPYIKNLTALMIRAYKDRGPNTAIGGLAVSSLTNDPQYSLFLKLLDDGIQRLRGRYIKRT